MFYLLFFFGIYALLALNEKANIRLKWNLFSVSLNNYINIFALLLLALLAGGRAITVGTDVRVYAIFHFKYNSNLNSINEFLSNYILEIGYEFENYLVTRFTNDIHWALFVNSVTVMIGLFFGAKFWSKKLAIPFSHIILFFILTGCFNISLNAIRQYMAITTLFGFSKFFFERNLVISCLGVILAYSFHSSGLVGILIYLIFSKKQSVVLYVVCFSLLSISTVPQFLINLNILPSRFYRYFTENPTGQTESVINLAKTVYLIIAITIWRRYRTPLSNIFLYISILNFGFSCLSFLFGALSRLELYFDIFDIVLLATFVNNYFISKTNKVITLISMNIFYSALFYWKFVVKNGSETFPYEWTWNLFS